MTQLPTADRPQLAQTSAEAMDQLSSIFAAYNATTERMQHSYANLQGEVERLRGELRQKNEQLERKSRLAALGQMAAGMAHEIRNPLGAVQLYVSLLQRDLAAQEKPLGWVGKIGNCVRNLDAIVTDMLTFTQDQDCEKTQVNFAGLLAETMDYVRPQCQSDAVTIDQHNVDASLVLDADVNMMQRILLNLLLNAVQAAGTDGTVTIAATRLDNDPTYNACICITDTGPGIKNDVMKKIFNPFFTTKDTGTGLGLAIVHRLVESHGGMITAANNKTGGAVFTILLP